MFKAIVIFLFGMFVIWFILTQIAMPFFTNYNFFWSFRKRENRFVNSNNSRRINIQTLEDLDREAEIRTESYKEVIEELRQTEEELNKIKNKTKNL